MTQPTPPEMTVRAIDAELTHALRQAVLRPHQTLGEMVYEGDDLPATLHLGAFDPNQPEGEPIGIATLYHTPMPGDSSSNDWRLRGMAVSADWQGRGVGGLLIRSSLEAVAERGGKRLWCNARVTAMRFYEKLGFVTHGEPFEITGIGPHYVMWIAAPDPPR